MIEFIIINNFNKIKLLVDASCNEYDDRKDWLHNLLNEGDSYGHDHYI